NDAKSATNLRWRALRARMTRPVFDFGNTKSANRSRFHLRFLCSRVPRPPPTGFILDARLFQLPLAIVAHRAIQRGGQYFFTDGRAEPDHPFDRLAVAAEHNGLRNAGTGPGAVEELVNLSRRKDGQVIHLISLHEISNRLLVLDRVLQVQ